MACKKTEQNTAKKMTTNEKYLHKIFTLLRKRDSVGVVSKKSSFNDTELRLLGEILEAREEGKRLISTQLANTLGVTRSAISQIVNRLEERDIVRRVADDVDRKIAYIEVTEKVVAQYEKEIKIAADFAGVLVKKYGVEKFKTLCALTDEFVALLDVEKVEMEKKLR